MTQKETESLCDKWMVFVLVVREEDYPEGEPIEQEDQQEGSTHCHRIHLELIMKYWESNL